MRTVAVENRGRGPWGWWLRLTAPAGVLNYGAAPTREDRDRLRRAGLTSTVAIFVIFAPLLLLGQFDDPSTRIAVVVFWVTTPIALVLNRAGHQTLAAILLIAVIDLSIEGSIVTAKGGLGTGWLLTFDLFVIPLIMVGVLLSRHYLWVFASIHVALILGDFYLLPHTADLTALIALWNGPAIAFARPIMVQLGGAVLSFAEVRSTDEAIRRADRAEEMQRLEHEVAEQRRQLETGVQELLATHVRVANGDFSARAPMSQGSALWQVSASLNNLLSRLQKTGQSEFQLKRTDQEIDRLAEALLQARAGRRPIWPAPTGTRVDRLLEVLLGAPRQPGQPPTGHLHAQMGQGSAPQLPGSAGGQPAWENPWQQSASTQATGPAPLDFDMGGQWGGGGPMRGYGEE